MTLPERSLHPARRNDRGSLLSALEFVARGELPLAQIVRTVVGQPVSLEPRPQIFDGIEVRGIGRKKGDLDVPVQGIELTFTPAGLSPAECASLRWTHNRA